ADLLVRGQTAAEATGCQHLDAVTTEIQAAIDRATVSQLAAASGDARAAILAEISRRNIMRVIGMLRSQSRTLARLENDGRIEFVGGLYDVAVGQIEWLVEPTGGIA